MLDRLKAKAAERRLFKVVAAEVALRTGPEASAPQVAVLEYGQVVLLRDLRQNGWARLDEEQAWASGLGVAAAGEGIFLFLGGLDLGLPACLRQESSAVNSWEYAEALRCSEANGAPWRRVPDGLRPKSLVDLAWLSPWHSPDGTILGAPALLEDPKGYLGASLLKLCVVSLVRGASCRALESLILQHFYAGFELVLLYFDAPHEPGETEATVTVEQFSKPQPLGPGGLLCSARAIRCTEAWWAETRINSRYYQREDQPLPLYSETVRLDAEVHDVQARQILVVEHALLEVQAARFHWLLHVDTDEVLYCPDEGRHPDARSFFAEVPIHFTSVRFANLEAAPESLEVEDPFQEVTVFKMNPVLLEELGVEPRILQSGEMAEEDEGHEPDLFDRRNADTVPGAMPHGFKRLPRRQRHALRRLLAAMHEIAEKRAPVLEELKVMLEPIRTSAPGETPGDSDSEWSDDESCYGPRPHCPAYFNSYSNGKCAVRTEIGPRGEMPPLPAGVHGFVRDGGASLYTLLCKGAGAPVVLHYANCGFTHWKRKYQTICKGHGTEDGAFSTEREGIAELRSHLASRQLILQNQTAALERFYRTFIQGNEFDELAFLAQFGLVLRLETPRARLDMARTRWAELSKGAALK